MTKKKSKNEYEKIGRPTKITPVVLVKLESAFAIGCSDVEACVFADISRDCLYDNIKKTPDFADKKEALKQNPILKAKQTIFDNLNDNKTAQWYLERKCKLEFGNSKPDNDETLITEGLRRLADNIGSSILEYNMQTSIQ